VPPLIVKGSTRPGVTVMTRQEVYRKFSKDVKADPKRPEKSMEIGTSCGSTSHVYGNVLQLKSDIIETSRAKL
jgi:hypothetical protein